VGTALLLLNGCQSTPPAHPPPRQTISPAAWKAEANRWLGVKYRKGGLDRAGIDCSGLTAHIYLAVAGIALPRTSQDQARCGKAVSRTELRPGDLLFFISLSAGVVDHAGLYLGDTQFVHASPSKGVVVSSLLQDYYARRYHSARRIIP
jgi:cell wall-associated NlpC family hydrolase